MRQLLEPVQSTISLEKVCLRGGDNLFIRSNFCLGSHFFKFGNKNKSHGPKSGESGRWCKSFVRCRDVRTLFSTLNRAVFFCFCNFASNCRQQQNPGYDGLLRHLFSQLSRAPSIGALLIQVRGLFSCFSPWQPFQDT